MIKELGPSNPEGEPGLRRFRIRFESRHSESCEVMERHDVQGPNEEEALRKFFEEHLDYGSGVFAEAIEELEATNEDGLTRTRLQIPDDATGERNEEVLGLVVGAAISARFIRPAGGPAPVVRWWEGGDEYLMSFDHVEDVTARRICPTCRGSGEIDVQQ